MTVDRATHTKINRLESFRLLALAELIGISCLLSILGCGGSNNAETAVQLKFRPMVGEQEAACGTAYSQMGTGSSAVELADARLFISSIALRHKSDSTWHMVNLDASIWQSGGIGGVVLLDFEDGTGACADSGTNETNRVITATVTLTEVDPVFDGIRFNVGIPFVENHVDAALTPAPFNVPGMYWTWQGGFKFVRVDWQVADLSGNNTTPSRWNVHVGSTGCESAAPTTAPSTACTRSNMARVELTDFDTTIDEVNIDLAQLIVGANLDGNTPDSPPGCMSNPGEPNDCTAVFDSLGLDFMTGACIDDCSNQTIFSLVP